MIEKLKEIGLTEYESKIYLTLLENGTLKGGEVHKKSGVPHSPTYHSLLSLQSKGFISVTPTKPKKFTAVNPKMAINNFINNKVMHVKEVEKEISEKLIELKKIKRKEEMIEKVTILAGLNKVWPLLQYLFNETEKTMRYMFTYEIRDYDMVKAIKDAIKRGVKVKILATKKSPQGLKWMKEDISYGAEVRYYRIEELRFVIKDEDKAFISMINPRDSRDRVITYFEHGLFSKILAEYFDEIWKKAKIIK